MKNIYLALISISFLHTVNLLAMEPIKTDYEKMIFLEGFPNMRIFESGFDDNLDIILEEFVPYLNDENPHIRKKALLCLYKFMENNEWDNTVNVNASKYAQQYCYTIGKIKNKIGLFDGVVNLLNFNDEEAIFHAYKCLLVMLRRRVPNEKMNGTILKLVNQIGKKLVLESEDELENKRSILALKFLKEIYEATGCRPDNIIATLLTSLPKLKSLELTSTVLIFVASLAKNTENAKKIISSGLRNITDLAMSSNIANVRPEQASMILKPIRDCLIILFIYKKPRPSQTFVPWNRAIADEQNLFNFICTLLDTNNNGFIYPDAIRKTAGYISHHLQLPVEGTKQELSVFLKELLEFKDTLEVEALEKFVLNDALKALTLSQEPQERSTFAESLKGFLSINRLDHITLAEAIQKISQTLQLGEERAQSGAFKECSRYMLGEHFSELPDEESIYCLIFLSQLDWGDNIHAAFEMNAVATFFKILQRKSGIREDCIIYNGQLFECLIRLIELDDLGITHKQITALNSKSLTDEITGNAENLFNNDEKKLNHLKEIIRTYETYLQCDKFFLKMNHIKNDLPLHTLSLYTKKHIRYFASLLLDNKSNQFSEKICLSKSIILDSELKRQILIGLWLSYHWELINIYAENPIEAFKAGS